jgi:hypothetical protein
LGVPGSPVGMRRAGVSQPRLEYFTRFLLGDTLYA